MISSELKCVGNNPNNLALHDKSGRRHGRAARLALHRIRTGPQAVPSSEVYVALLFSRVAVLAIPAHLYDTKAIAKPPSLMLYLLF